MTLINMKLITVNLPEAYVNGIERLIVEKLYPNRSEAIRIAVRDLLKKELWEQTVPQPKIR
jgi:antitoxin ParD1/3/4